MFLAKESRKEVQGLSDLIDYQILPAEGVVFTSSGYYLATWMFRGPDMDSMSPEEAYFLSLRIAMKLRLGTGWTIACNMIRSPHPEYAPETGNWPDPISYLIDLERRQRFTLREGPLAPRLSKHYVTLCYDSTGLEQKRAKKAGNRFADWVFQPDQEEQGSLERKLEEFQKKVVGFDNLLCNSLPTVKRLSATHMRVGEHQQLCDDQLRFFRRCITSEDYPFAVPDCPVYLNQYLSPGNFAGGAEPMLGDSHIRVIAIDSFPEHSCAGMLRELDCVPFDFRLVQQATILDEWEAKETHEANRQRWTFQKDPKAHSPIKSSKPHRIDSFAAKMEMDAESAESLAKYGKEISCRYSGKVILTERDPEQLSKAADAVMNTLKFRCGFSCRVEVVNPTGSWISRLPGHHHREKRTFTVTTENLLHMMPLSAPFRGYAHCISQYFPPGQPPLLYCLTAGGTVYRYQPYTGYGKDVGHIIIVGPNGSGKTTWVAANIAQWFRYANSQVFAFDKRRTLYTLTKAMGGHFYELSPNSHHSRLCPLQHLNDEIDIDWAMQWIELLLSQNDVPVDATIRNQIKEELRSLAKDPHSLRSLTNFRMAHIPDVVKAGLETYCNTILDGEYDNLALGRFVVFEMDELYRLDKKVMNGALSYLFHRIRRRLRSDIPTLVTVDEFRESLSHPMAAKFFDEFLLEGRRLNCAVWMAVQHLAQVLGSPLKATILGQCFTRICLADHQAVTSAAAAYKLLDLTEEDLRIIAEATPKSDYYIVSPDAKRLVSLALDPLTLSFVGASSDTDRPIVDDLIARYGDQWPGEWLRMRGLSEWAEEFDYLQKQEANYAIA